MSMQPRQDEAAAPLCAFAFDLTLTTVARMKTATEAEALERLEQMQAFVLDVTVDGVHFTEASVTGTPELFEVNDAHVDRSPTTQSLRPSR